MSDSASPELALLESENQGEVTPAAGPVPRLWPALVILLLQLVTLGLTVTPSINNFLRFVLMMLGPAVCVLLFMAWLLLASRLQWRHRFLILSGQILSMVLIGPLLHESMYVAFWIYGAPLSIALITLMLWIASRWRSMPRTITTVAVVLTGASLFLVGRLDGFDGNYLPELRWRWTQPSELSILAEKSGESKTVEAPAELPAVTASDWPAFRGAGRDGIVTTAKLPVDWEANPLEEMWRAPVGPAWSSFASVGDRLYTQEQRGENELVVCYDASTGTEIWRRADNTRFNEVVSGSGPRATPTYADGKLFTLGGTALLNCLDAATGELKWQKELGQSGGGNTPIWGYSSSPAVVDSKVIVYTGGPKSGEMTAFDVETGDKLWSVDSPGMNYSSPHVATVAGRTLVLIAGPRKIIAADPASGEIAWQYKHNGDSNMGVVQPQVIDGKTLIIPFGDGAGVARIDVTREDDAWQVEHQWDSKHLKPSFNDFVYFKNHIYGFDQEIFACIDIEQGRRQWKGGRYGFGQVILFPQQSLLLVAAENGELVLLKATPDGHQELARLQAIQGKTWNHPMVSGNRLIVRNGAEAVCYRLPDAS